VFKRQDIADVLGGPIKRRLCQSCSPW